MNAPGIKGRRRFKPIDGINIYNIRLLVDGKDNSHMKMHNKQIGSKILQLSQKIKCSSPDIHNLVANITSSNNSNLDFLIAPRPHKRKKGIVVGTDKFWEKAEPESPKIITQKNIIIKNANKLFKPQYNKPIDVKISKFKTTFKAIGSFISYIFSQKYNFRYKQNNRKKIKQNKKLIGFYTI